MNSETPKVRGLDLDSQTRCRHFHGPTDIVAIKMRCCEVFYACKDCHEVLTNHPIQVWSKSEWNQSAILCGACGAELTIQQYLEGGFQCTVCQMPFNPACRNHYHYYFEY